MKRFALLLLLANSSLAAPPAIEIPPEVRPSGDYIALTPKTDAVSVIYVGLSGVDSFPSAFLKDPRSFVLPVRGLAAGRYKFAAVASSKDGEQVRVDFAAVIGTPPDPPKPPDDPPAPADPFVKALQTAYAAETGPKKAAWLSALAKMYRAESGPMGAIIDPLVLTPVDLFQRMGQKRRESGIGDQEFLSVRQAIAVEFDKKLPLGPASREPMTQATWNLVTEEFARIATALEAVK